MTAPYSARLVCLCLAAFFLVHLAAAAMVRLLAPAFIRMAQRMRPRLAARFLLGLRLLPTALAAFVVAGLCAPSYLWLEPAAGSEDVGAACLAAAALGAVLWAESLVRGLRAAARSAWYVRECRKAARQMRCAGQARAVWVVPAKAPFLVLAGVWRTRLVVSQAVVDALGEEQLAAALRHERAHQESHDNLKRLVALLAPGILPGVRGLAPLERAWARFTEWAADDRAVAGDSRASLSLAEALVRVARLGGAPPLAPLTTSLMADGRDLAERVERLLRPAANPARGVPLAVTGTAAALCAAAAMSMLNPAVLYSVHGLLEHLTR
jgi:Zn-dependent protease with chaperone function